MTGSGTKKRPPDSNLNSACVTPQELYTQLNEGVGPKRREVAKIVPFSVDREVYGGGSRGVGDEHAIPDCLLDEDLG